MRVYVVFVHYQIESHLIVVTQLKMPSDVDVLMEMGFSQKRALVNNTVSFIFA